MLQHCSRGSAANPAGTDPLCQAAPPKEVALKGRAHRPGTRTKGIPASVQDMRFAISATPLVSFSWLISQRDYTPLSNPPDMNRSPAGNSFLC